jgi:AcrR family transcriptional regulator
MMNWTCVQVNQLTWTHVQLSAGVMTARMPVADRRTQLVDAALSVAVTDGIGATTVRRVAERAGVSLGVVHYCFADKDELFVALAARIVDELAAGSAAALAPGKAPDVAAALRLAVDGLWRRIEAAPAEQLLTYEITVHALRNPPLGAVAARQYAASQRAVEELLALVAEAGRSDWTRPVPELAAETLAYVDGVTLRWLVDRDGAAARSRLAAFAGYLAANARRRRGRR